jgi:hypothetical protein
LRDPWRASFDRPRCAFDALAIARVGDAFASSLVDAIADRRHHHHRFLFGTARNGKSAADRPGFNAGRDASPLTLSNLHALGSKPEERLSFSGFFVKKQAALIAGSKRAAC